MKTNAVSLCYYMHIYTEAYQYLNAVDSLSRPRLSRITAYLEVKMSSLLKMEI